MADKPEVKKLQTKDAPKRKETSKWKWPSLASVLFAIGIGVVFGVYYVRTPEETLVVVPAPFPPDWAAGFTKEELGEDLLASIQNIRLGAKSVSPRGASAGLQVASPMAPYVPWASALPSFDQEVHKITLNMVRQWALSAKAKHFLHLRGIKSGATGFRLDATLQDRPDSIIRSWRVPASQKPCEQLDVCTVELAEGVLALREPHALVLYYLNQKTAAADIKIVEKYQSGAIAASEAIDHYAWGDALRGLKRYDEAMIQYQKAIEMNSSLCGAYDAIGTTEIRKYEQSPRAEYLEAAAGSYHDALRCNPNDAAAHCDLGNVYIRKWKASNLKDDDLHKWAVEENEQALRMEPDLAEAAVNLGYAQYLHGEHTEAIEYFRGLEQRFPNSQVVFVNDGFLLFKEYLHGNSGVLQDALDATRRAWDLDSDHRDSATADNLGVLYYETDSLSEAVRLWEIAHTLDPISPGILASYGLGLFKSGKREEAIGFYGEAVRRDPHIRNPEVLREKYFWTEKAIKDVNALDRLVFPPV